jgi:FRG domain
LLVEHVRDVTAPCYDPAPLKEEHNLRTWGGFLKRAAAISSAGGELLFRGHADSKWSLTTTLERRGYERMEVAAYYKMIRRAKSQIESITGSRFDLPTYDEIRDLVASYDDFSLALSGGGFPGYSFLIHLRHHGFPSPLLDWTRSPYVAAFFAFAAESKGAKKRSIYAWTPSRFRGTGTNTPELKRLGPYITTHRRHVLQQGDYTVCPTFGTDEMKWRFTPHEETIASDEGPLPHRLWKFNLPSKERFKVLGQLDEMNLNAYSLFGSEESLMDTIALREMELHRLPKTPKS